MQEERAGLLRTSEQMSLAHVLTCPCPEAPMCPCACDVSNVPLYLLPSSNLALGRLSARVTATRLASPQSNMCIQAQVHPPTLLRAATSLLLVRAASAACLLSASSALRDATEAASCADSLHAMRSCSSASEWLARATSWRSLCSACGDA